MRRKALLALPALLAFTQIACGGPTRVALLQTTGLPATMTPSSSVPLEVVTRSTAVNDPLPVSGTPVVYGDVEAALGLAVTSAAGPWADAHRARYAGDQGGWQMSVELINAEAEHKNGRLVVTLGVRATLRARADRRFIAQTQASCRQAAVVSPETGGPIVYACMSRIGRDLAGWLGGVEPVGPTGEQKRVEL